MEKTPFQSDYYPSMNGSTGSPYPKPPKKTKVWPIVLISIVSFLVFSVLSAGVVWLLTDSIRDTWSLIAERMETADIIVNDEGELVTETTSNDAALPEGDETLATDKYFSVVEAATLGDQGDKKALSVPEIADKVGPATVSIYAEITEETAWGPQQYQSSGSGFIVSTDGYIVTNNHVVAGATAVTVLVPGDTEPIEATIVGTDSRSDIAVLHIDRTDLPICVLGDSDTLEVGELAVAIGNPMGTLAGTVTAGVISATNRSLTVDNITRNMIQTDASINSGNSGGPLVNSYGEVIGVTNAKVDSSDGLGFAIPINDIKSIITDLINDGEVHGRTFLGVTTMTIDEATAEQFNWPTGAYIQGLYPDGPAEEAGLLVGDIITEIDGEPITANTQLQTIRDQHEVGDELEFTIFRDGSTLTVTLTIGEE
ncbi:MAG TPA: trypsin-like peptidase domain-containing protein [Bacillota bacterium]|nr:trypsin-like peptidase domain-containing protein [Bacillota bacterium]